MLKPTIVLLLLCALAFGSATNVYVTPAGTATGNCPTGTGTAPNFTAAQFSSSTNWGAGSGKIGAGTTILVCGTFTGSANSTLFTWQPGTANGSAGNPITMTFDMGAVLQAPYFAASVGGVSAGAISMGSGGTYLVIDLNNATIQNTANGSSLTNQQASTGISAFACNHCTITNSGAQNAGIIANLYVNVAGSGTLGDNSVVRAIDYTGSNWQINNLTIHDCGWCVLDSYNNGDTNNSVYGNNLYNFGHAFAMAAGAANACTAPCYFLHDNLVHDSANWTASGCPFHQDGLHIFGVIGSSIDGVYVYNNYFYGDWGTCPTAFIFVEAGGGGSPSNMHNSYWWNNVMVVQNTGFENTNGWFDVASGVSGVQWFYNNTIVGHGGGADNTLCYGIEELSGPIFKNNVALQCGNPLSIQGTTVGNLTADYNYYGTYTCLNGSNCFVNNGGTYEGSFATWKSYCSCDSHSILNTSSTLFNSDGSPQASSPVIGQGTNLSASATGNVASLQSDTTEGGTRSVIVRPSGATAWDIGAFQFAATPPSVNGTASPRLILLSELEP